MQRDPEAVETRYLKSMADFENAHILEVGCGNGRLTWRYVHDARRVTAIDPDPIRLADAVAACPQTLTKTVTFVQSFSQTLPFRSQTFDGVLLSWSL